MCHTTVVHWTCAVTLYLYYDPQELLCHINTCTGMQTHKPALIQKLLLSHLHIYSNGTQGVLLKGVE